MYIKNVLAGTILIASISGAYGHGLMVDPPSRNAICGLQEKPDQASTEACVDAFAQDAQGGYQFMSVLTHTEGLAKATTLPANVCGFDSEVWEGQQTPWDVPTNWPTNSASPGPVEITWDIQWGPHFDDTREFHYWITKPDFVFDATKPLTWDDFEADPFCAEGYDDTQPTANPNVVADKTAVTFKTSCELPARNGHHVVYGEWGRNYYTFERFHGCIDFMFGSNNEVPPSATAQTVSTEEETPVAIALTGTDSDGTVVSYSITTTPLNGTLGGAGNQLTYTPSVGFYGSDSFQFTVTDNDGLISQPATVTIQVNRAGNSAPTATFNSSSIELLVTFDATASTDPDGDVLSFDWDFGDGNVGTGAQVSHQYLAPNLYSVELTVSDGVLQTTTTQDIQVTSTSASATCEYVISNSWNGGFVAEIRIINTGTETIDGWQVEWTYANPTDITNAWNANLNDGSTIVAVPVSWNRTIEPGSMASFGVQGTFSGELEMPTVTGNVCP